MRFFENFFVEDIKLIRAKVLSKKTLRHLPLNRIISYSISNAFSFLAIVVFFIGLVIFGVFVRVIPISELFFMWITNDTKAVITKIEETNISRGKRKNRIPYFNVEYKYNVKGIVYNGNVFVNLSRSTFEKTYQLNDSILIETDYFLPYFSHLKFQHPNFFEVIFHLIMLSFFLIFGAHLFLMNYYSNFHIKVIMFEYGDIVTGILVAKLEVENKKRTSNEKISYDLIFYIEEINKQIKVNVPFSGPYFLNQKETLLCFKDTTNYYIPIKEYQELEYNRLLNNEY